MYNCSVAMTRLVALGASDFLTIVSLISMMIAVLMFSRHLGSMLRRVHRGIVAVVLVVVRHGSSKRSLERGVHDLLLYAASVESLASPIVESLASPITG